METRSSHVLVGGVVLVLTVALFAFILWLARFSGAADKREFDIFFGSVSGLARGAAVNFSGVPVGTVETIALLPNQPDKVRVRISVDPSVPVLQGTRATVAGVGFTGVSVVSLEGAMAGQAPITAPGPFGKPVIPTKAGALQGLLDQAPELLQNASTLLQNLNNVLNAENQKKLSELLTNLNATTSAFAQSSPKLSATLDNATQTLATANGTLAKFGHLADSTSTLLDKNGKGLADDLHKTTVNANATLASLKATSDAARPAVEQLSQRTLPEATGLLRDLRATQGSLGAVASKLDEDPAGAILGGRKLPDYNPKKAH